MDRNILREGGSKEDRLETTSLRADERAAADGRSSYYERAMRRRTQRPPMSIPPSVERPSATSYGPGVGQIERRSSGGGAAHWTPTTGQAWSVRAGDLEPTPEARSEARETPLPHGASERRAIAVEGRRWGDPSEPAPTWSVAPPPPSSEAQGAARPSRRKIRWTREPMTAGEIMSLGVRSVLLTATVSETAQIMRDENCGIVPVVDDERRLLGVVTDRDIVIRGHAEGRPSGELRVEDVLSADVECVTADDEVGEVLEVMGRRQMRRIPVVDKRDRLLGVVSMSDLASRADYDEELQDALERLAARRSFWSRAWS